jgi:hypothetical protein
VAKLSVAEAARTWIEGKRQEAQIQAKLEASKAVLLDHFRKNDRRDYKGLIGYSVRTQVRLDTEKVKAELGDRLPRFQKTVDYEQLSLLK